MRKEKNFGSDFISSQAIVFLVEGSRDEVLNKIPMVLHLEEDPKTYTEAMASRDSTFQKEAVNDEMDSLLSNGTWVLVDIAMHQKLWLQEILSTNECLFALVLLDSMSDVI